MLVIEVVEVTSVEVFLSQLFTVPKNDLSYDKLAVDSFHLNMYVPKKKI